ncbi:MFS general substrate transporter [Punctularia strigosozonata HHB-11173 SS5]|uniref:MFS general substrate transporter n=1 Tax=Punctularia strigosozonata (strain HHB-11173) TaxID=741275 RepID=UPI0004417C8A|nr:MFS general substrate transporter [Punctularia strigosozonata HHB-11173 SS5]EIN14719.1 MFS general substrate transporter [Punctularia strigosozonata HHB-11173 SS5]
MAIVDDTSMERFAIEDEKPAVDAMVETVDGSSHTERPEEALQPPPMKLTPEEERKLYRKIDLRLIPIMWLMYLGSQVDRSNIGNAKLQGLLTQLHLTGHRYNITLMMFFIPYCLFEFPSNLVLKKFRPSRWLPGITVAWGTITALMGLAKTYPQLVGIRTCLGVAEAGFFPGVAYYMSIWYPRHMLQYRLGLFYSAATVAGGFSGLLAFAISFMSGTHGLLGWSWIFILEGSATVGIGILAFLVMVDFPESATFLTEKERAYVLWKKRYDNSAIGEEEHFEPRHVVAALCDWQVWAHIIVYMCVIVPVFGITLFLPSIINGFGFSTTVSQLLTVPPYALGTLTIISCSYYSDKLKQRSPFILAGLVMCLIGFSINIAPVHVGVKYFGTFFIVAGGYGTVAGVVAWFVASLPSDTSIVNQKRRLGNNIAGHYKRGAGIALHVGIGNFGGVVASNIYRTQDAPKYVLGHAIELMFVGIGLVVVPVIMLAYMKINQRRARSITNVANYSPEQLRALGDRAPSFRYTL